MKKNKHARKLKFVLAGIVPALLMVFYANCGGQDQFFAKENDTNKAPSPPVAGKPGSNSNNGAAIPQSGLRIWLKGDEIKGAATDAVVSSWPNSAPEGGEATPLFSTSPVFKRAGSELKDQSFVAFNGSIMSLPNEINIKTKHTVAAVFNKRMKGDTYYQTGHLISGGKDGYTNGFDKGVMSPLASYGGTNIGSNPSFIYWFTDNYSGNYPAFLQQTTFTMDHWHRYIMTRDRDSVNFSLDGAATRPSPQNASSVFPKPDEEMKVQFIGGQYNGWQSSLFGSDEANCFHGDIAEVIVYDRVLSAEELTQVSTYLTAKYGI